ncbi:MAG: hypothetical protein ACRDRV_22205 [Pseudonocardiaceae bacterium]
MSSTWGPRCLPRDCPALAEEIGWYGVALVILDPLISAVDPRINVNQEELRTALEPLAALGDQTGTAIFGLAHFNKAGGADVLSRITGSRAFSAVARAAIAFARDPHAEDGSCVVSQVKNNLGRLDLPSLRYVVESVTVQTTEAPASGDDSSSPARPTPTSRTCSTTPRTATVGMTTRPSLTSGYGPTSPSKAAQPPPPPCSSRGAVSGTAATSLNALRNGSGSPRRRHAAGPGNSPRPTPPSGKGARRNACLRPCSLAPFQVRRGAPCSLDRSLAPFTTRAPRPVPAATARSDAMITPPGRTAQLDQFAAATTDAYRRLTLFGNTHNSPVRLGPVPAWLVPHVRRLSEALTTGTGRRCAHLGTAPAVAHAAVWDPGHLTCDHCHRPGDPIHPGALALGPVLLAFGLCPRCLHRTEPATRSRKGNRP